MDKFLVHGPPAAPPPDLTDCLSAASQTGKMAEGAALHPGQHPPGPSYAAVVTDPASSAVSPEHYSGIAQAVAALLSPTITAAVDKAMAAGIAQIRKDLSEHAFRLTELESRVTAIEEETQASFHSEERFKQTQQYLLEKVDDLENRSRRNNLRIIGLPESFGADSLMELCSQRIPQALGLTAPCIAERAHRVGPPSNERRSPRPVIVKYLNFADRNNLMKSYRNSKALQIDGHKLLLFADYSQEVSRRRKALQPICNALYQQGIKFTLAYPATLRFTDPSGLSKSFTHPDDAWDYLNSHLRLPMDTSAPPAQSSARYQHPRDQRSPRKEPAKKLRLTDLSGKYNPV